MPLRAFCDFHAHEVCALDQAYTQGVVMPLRAFCDFHIDATE